MLRITTLALVTASLALLAGCHSNAGYFSPNPELTYGPGVVEFPDPLRVYVPGGSRVHAARHVASSWAPASGAPYGSPSGHPPGEYEYEVIYIEEVTNAPPRSGYRSPAYPYGTQSGSPEYRTPSHEAPLKYGRRVRRIPGQPLGVEFTD